MSAQGIPLKSDFRERARVNDIPVARLIGFEAREIADGRATVMLQSGPQHANPMGTLHGGVLCDLADAAMGMAFASTLAPEESFTTMTLGINFFRLYGKWGCGPRPVLSTGERTWAMLSVRLPIRTVNRLPKQTRLASSCAANTQESGELPSNRE